MKFKLFIALFLVTHYSFSQSSADEKKWGVVLEHPEMKNVIVKSDITYFKNEKVDLKLDVYLPSKLKSNEKKAAIIFFPENSKSKSWELYKSWGKLVAAYGFVGITIDVDVANYKESVKNAFVFLNEKGREYKIDTNRLGVFAAAHIPDEVIAYFVNESVRDNKSILDNVKAISIYYTPPSITGPLRKDVNVLYVTDDQLHPSDTRFTSLWNEVQKSRAPWTIKYAAGMPFLFDAYSDNPEARKIIRETIYFWKNHLEPIPDPSWKGDEERSMIASRYSGDAKKARELFKRWLEKNPDDQYANLEYAQMMLGIRNFEDAERAYRKLKSIPANSLIDFAQVLYAINKPEEAEQFISKAMIRNNTYSSIGSFLYSISKYKESKTYYEKGIAHYETLQIQPRGIDFYNLACCAVKLNDHEKAFETLNKAADSGYNSKQKFENNADLESLKSDLRWKALLEKLK